MRATTTGSAIDSRTPVHCTATGSSAPFCGGHGSARVSDRTAFFWLGRLVEYGFTDRIFTNPAEKLTEDYVTGRFG